MTALPQEIIDHVIDLVQDTKALRACSLTCRSWAYRSQSELHRTVKISCRSSLDPDFYNSSKITLLTQRLVLTFPDDPSHTFPESSIWTIVLRFTNVQDLTLIGACWDYSEEDQQSFATLFSGVTSLRLRHCEYRGLANLLSLISVFPDLRELELDDISWKTENDIESPSPQLPVSGFRRLIISGATLGFVPPIALWLGALPGKNLRDFRLSWKNTAPEGERALKSLLGSLSSSLAHLEIDTEAFRMGELGRYTFFDSA